MSDKIIKLYEFEKSCINNDYSLVKDIWEKILAKLQEEYRKEAREKGFILTLYSEDRLSKNFLFKVPNASEELSYKLFELYPFLICLKE